MSPPPAINPAPDEMRGFRTLYARALGPLRRYLSRLLGDTTEAQDVAHDAFVKVHAAMHARPLEHPQAYLYTTARRLAIDELRRRRNDPLHRSEGTVIEAVFSEAPDVACQVMARQELEQFLHAVNALPPGCRMVFMLGRLDNLTHQEIANRLGIAVSTVEKQHARAIRLLRPTRLGDAAPPHRSATGTHGSPPRRPLS